MVEPVVPVDKSVKFTVPFSHKVVISPIKSAAKPQPCKVIANDCGEPTHPAALV